MKKLLLTAVLAVACLLANAQTLKMPLVNDKVEYTEIIKLKDSTISKEALYNRAYAWFASTFTNSNAVLRIQDKENGKITGRGTNPFYGWSYINTQLSYLNYFIDIDVKQGRYRYRIHSMDVAGTPEMTVTEAYTRYLNNDGIPVDVWFDTKKKVAKRYGRCLVWADSFVQGLAKTLKEKMEDNSSDNF